MTEDQKLGEASFQIRIERKLLRALNDRSVPAGMRELIKARLARHRFVDGDHALIFRALSASAGLPEDEAALLQSLALSGFPDIDVRAIFSEAAPKEQEIAELLKQI